MVERRETGTVYREFMHVGDLADAIIFSLKYWNPDHEYSPKDIYGNSLNHLNVGTGKDITIKQLAEMISKITKFDGNIIWDVSKPDGTIRKTLDVSQINKLGWNAKIDLPFGLRNTINNLDKLDFSI